MTSSDATVAVETIPTQGGDAFRQLQAEISSLKARLDSLSAAINAANASNGTLA